MVTTLNKMIGGASGGRADGMASEQSANSTSPGDTATAAGSGRIVVDASRNLMIFRGSGREWSEILSVVKVLDKPVPSVLIEVLIAEITLNDEEGTGFEFLLRDDVGGDYGIEGGTLGALGLTERGLSMVLDSGGQTRAVLNLFYDENRVSIRSSPKLLVKSGEEASIEVGNEIPVITQLSDSGFQEDSDTSVLQEVTYRKTGVLLTIRPLVQASGLVDLEINQELSEAQPTAATSLEGSPTILNRTITTSLTLKDGGSLLMGGLISNTQSSGETGVPGFAKIPIIGRLFRNDTYNGDRTELLVMVIPYVISDHEEGWRLTESIKQSLELHPEYEAKP
jgi:general secretion pathway protein D